MKALKAKLAPLVFVVSIFTGTLVVAAVDMVSSPAVAYKGDVRPPAKQTAVSPELKALQRVHQLSPSNGATGALLAGRIQSASAITNVTSDSFSGA